jgi:ABC-type glycerol-3-phosphate transport system permease component
MLPIAKPAMATLVIITFVGSWRSFMWPLIVCNSEDIFNLPLGLTTYRGLFGIPDWPLLMAGSVFMTIPMVIIFVLGQRYFVEGIRLGAVKG